MKLRPLNLVSISSILLLIAAGRSSAQTPPRDDRPRAASIGGRVTVGGAPAANALVTVAEVDPQSGGAWAGFESPQGATIEVRTDSDGRYRAAVSVWPGRRQEWGVSLWRAIRRTHFRSGV